MVVPRPHTAQEQRTQESRQRILDAAVACLIERGYAGASTLRIQRQAGVSRGRLLHHFPSRDLLLVGAVAHLAESRIVALRTITPTMITAGPADPLRVDQVVEMMWTTFQQGYFWAAVELWVAARANEGLRAALKPVERRIYRSIRSALDEMFGPVYTAQPRYRLAQDVLVTSMRGVALTYAFDRRRPSRDPHLAQWKETAHTLLDSGSGPATKTVSLDRDRDSGRS